MDILCVVNSECAKTAFGMLNAAWRIADGTPVEAPVDIWFGYSYRLACQLEGIARRYLLVRFRCLHDRWLHTSDLQKRSALKHGTFVISGSLEFGQLGKLVIHLAFFIAKQADAQLEVVSNSFCPFLPTYSFSVPKLKYSLHAFRALILTKRRAAHIRGWCTICVFACILCT